MQRVAPEVALESRVRFQERDRHPAARQQQGQHHSTRAAANDTAAGVMHIEYFDCVACCEGIITSLPQFCVVNAHAPHSRGFRPRSSPSESICLCSQ